MAVATILDHRCQLFGTSSLINTIRENLNINPGLTIVDAKRILEQLYTVYRQNMEQIEDNNNQLQLHRRPNHRGSLGAF